MPQRFLRPDIRTSGRWNIASFGAQSLYIGLVTLVDDFGRYDGRPKLLHGEVFALRDDVKPQQTAAWLSELDKLDLIHIYSVDGKTYLQITRWKERARSETSKFPVPPLRNPAESCGILPPSSSSSPSSSSPSFGPNGQAAPAALSVGIEEIWKAYPRRVKKPAAVRAIQKALKKVSPDFLLARTLAYAETQPDNDRFTPHPATWFNAEQYLDDPQTWVPNDSQQKKTTGDIQWTD